MPVAATFPLALFFTRRRAPAGRCVVRIALTLAAVLMLLQALPTAAQAADASREYQVKAAFIYNFAQFFYWPPEAFADEHAPFTIAIVGNDPFQGFLDQTTAGKTVGSRPVVVTHVDVDHVGQACQILFVPGDQENAAGIVHAVGDRPVLLVGERDDFITDGGMVRFFIEESRIRFEMNPAAVRQAGLKVSAKLLKLARLVSP